MKSLFIVFLAGISLQLMAQDFRKAKWGESMNIVKSKETASIMAEKSKGNMLYYSSTLGDKKVEIAYKFVSNKLVRAKYIFKEVHSNKNVYYTDYLNFKSMLTKKYGEPAKYEQKWRDDTYKDEIDRIGFSISTGKVAIFESWDLQKTEITHAIYGGKNQISHVIEYSSVNFAYLEKDAQKKSAMDDL
jgi:hypothetical protein